MSNVDYIQQKKNRKHQYLRLRLGILQMVHNPLLNLFFLLIIAGTAVWWMKKDIAFSLFDVPQIFLPIYRYTIIIISVLMPIICIFGLIDAIGELTARKDEAKLYVAFNSQELRNGCPILMNKKQMKSNVIMREFYSDIPMKLWIERQEDIADAMNIHFVEKLRYGGKSDGKRIVMITAQGRKTVTRSDLYDDEL